MLIDSLVERGIKLHIIEIGASVPLAYNLLRLPGASKVIHCSESPYGTAVEKYDIKCRMVSEEAVRQIALKTSELYGDENPVVNMIVVTSFQIQSNNDVIPHGWVYTLYFDGDYWTCASYHFTYWDNDNLPYYNNKHIISSGKLTREESIDYIGRNLMRLLKDEYDFKEQTYMDISSHSSILDQENMNTLACFVGGKPVRFEDYSRLYDNLVLYKGSFNPVHVGHLEIAKDAQNRCPNSMVVFALSRDTYQKGRISNEDLMKRIKDINDHGYMAMVFDSGFFYDNYLAVSRRFSGKTFIALGADSFNRLIKCYENNEFSELEKYNTDDFASNNEKFQRNFGDAHFLVYGRRQEIKTGDIQTTYDYIDFDVNVSSTEVRQLRDSGNSEEANKLTGKGK